MNKNSRQSRSSKNWDLNALRVLISIIAISSAGRVGDASPTLVETDVFKPILSTLDKQLEVCPVPYSTDSCPSRTEREFCLRENPSFLQSYGLPSLFKTSTAPQCSWPIYLYEKRENES